MASWKPGQTIAGRLTIEGRLASGGMAQLYLAQMEAPGGMRRRVVAKRVHPHLAEDPDFVTMFFDEARVGSQLSHPGLVPVLDAIVDGTELILILDYVPGWDLGALLREAKARDQPPPWTAVLAVALGVAETLQYVHAAKDVDGRPLGVVHRDVTPANVLVATDGSVRLLDFGVAKAASQVARTATGIMKANPAYAAPEQALGQPVDGRTDLYTLGLILYELLTLHRAIEGEDPLARLANAANPSFPPPSWFRADVPPSLEQLTMALLDTSMELRPPDAAALGPLAAAATDEVGLPDRDALRLWVVELVGSVSRPLETGRTALDRALAGVAGIEGGSRTRASTIPPGAHPTDGTVVDTPEALPLAGVDSSPPTTGGLRGLGPKRRRNWVVPTVLLGMVAVGVAAGAWSLFEAPPSPSGDDGQEASSSFGFLRVSTEPSGAMVRLDGEPTSTPTPTIVRAAAGVSHHVEVQLEGYEPQEQEVAIAADETLDLGLDLEPALASLAVSSRPSGASVRFRNRNLGRTPVSREDLPPGRGPLTVTHPGFRTHRERLELDSQQIQRVDVDLERLPQTGQLAVSSRPWARVRVGSRVVAESTPATGISLPVGVHVVTLDNPRLGLRERRRVRIRAGQTTRLVVELD